MADLTAPDAIAFSNQEIRTAADALSQSLSRIDLILMAIQPQVKGFMAQFAADPTGLVVDGSPADGRTPIHCGDGLLFFGLCQNLQTTANATLKLPDGTDTGITPRQLIAKIAVNG